MYAKFAQWYDFHYRSIKDYDAEVERVAYLLEKLGPKPSVILDVACGAGEHARILSERYGYAVDGIDLEPGLVEAAQLKNPSGDFTVADMTDFRLPKSYDVVSCLFSSIGYVETLAGLDQAIASMARHLKPGGWLLLEPWVEPEAWKDGIADATESHDEATGVRVLQTRLGKLDGAVSEITIDYDIETPDERLAFTETHRLGLFARDEVESALSRHHFESQRLPAGVLNNPLYVACYTP
ncbi:MAG: hypothetical protein CBD18_09235 [Opitutales bacterium TMED158]|nr:MAG: hypothetical protein CBD18_09235 [Opitutales bacterium TMED158]